MGLSRVITRMSSSATAMLIWSIRASFFSSSMQLRILRKKIRVWLSSMGCSKKYCTKTLAFDRLILVMRAFAP